MIFVFVFRKTNCCFCCFRKLISALFEQLFQLKHDIRASRVSRKWYFRKLHSLIRHCSYFKMLRYRNASHCNPRTHLFAQKDGIRRLSTRRSRRTTSRFRCFDSRCVSVCVDRFVCLWQHATPCDDCSSHAYGTSTHIVNTSHVNSK